MGLTRRVGLFGGSFDPVHNAHLALARLALAQLALDELRWIPAGLAWQKERALSAAADRCAMLRLALGVEPRFVLDESEVGRSGPSYTIDTVRALHQLHPQTQWFLLIGQDQYAGLHSWRDWRELLSLVTLVVAGRPGAPLTAAAEVAAFACQFLPLPPMPISATEVRARSARGENIADLVPPSVARYIDQHRLYRADPRS
jgi:nicotinate-nucleotide adenylyltransferase